ncbi:MAG TPA: cytochrome B, partial [Rhodobacteraceae bacterium]|nr:cytochrome B [Paracoccaceae bacterium]
MSKRQVKIYPRFERIWHWTQALLILVLLFTGMGLNGLHHIIPFGPAVIFHTIAALLLLVLWIFATFWLFTTGTWRQFVPTLDGLVDVIRFYAYGVFKGEKHPHKKVIWRKHNPLQILAYFGLKVAVFPLVWITGILYMTYNFWEHIPDAGFYLNIVANLHL